MSTPTGAHDVALMPLDHVIQVATMTARLTTGEEPPYGTMTTGDRNIDNITMYHLLGMSYKLYLWLRVRVFVILNFKAKMIWWVYIFVDTLMLCITTKI